MKYIAAVLVVILVFLATVVEVRLRVPLVQAAAPAAGPLCEPIGIVGNVIISRCEDEDTGAIIYANSAGYMLLGE